jgi:hypothetical protein
MLAARPAIQGTIAKTPRVAESENPRGMATAITRQMADP